MKISKKWLTRLQKEFSCDIDKALEIACSGQLGTELKPNVKEILKAAAAELFLESE